MDTLKATAAHAAAVVAPTHTTDSALRMATCDQPTFHPVRIDGGDAVLVAEKITATYRTTATDGVAECVVNVHVVGRRRGAKGAPVGDYRSVWYLARPGDDPAESWPADILAWVERWHPARGGPDNDPTGSYL